MNARAYSREMRGPTHAHARRFVCERLSTTPRRARTATSCGPTIHVIPVLIGEGIPLVQPRRRTTSLSLISSHAYTDGVVRLHYSVRTRE
jgi:hypothetical protein